MALLLLVLVFAGAGGAVWRAGVTLSRATDVLAERLNLGQTLGGAVLLAVATNLPEIAILVSAVVRDALGIAVGNILGGIAVQTVVLAGLDATRPHGAEPITDRAASLLLVLEGLLVVAVLAVVVLGNQLPASFIAARLAPGSVAIAAVWLAGLWLLQRARAGLPWKLDEEPRETDDEAEDSRDDREKPSTGGALLRFALAAVVTLAAGAALLGTSEAMSDRIGMSGVVFGATVLAAVTALPEVSTGYAALRLGDYRLAVSDIFGGNAFLPVLFLPASLLSAKAVIPQAQNTDIYLTALGMLLTLVYVIGLIVRPRREVVRMGVDSFVVIVLYALGIAGLVAVAHG